MTIYGTLTLSICVCNADGRYKKVIIHRILDVTKEDGVELANKIAQQNSNIRQELQAVWQAQKEPVYL